MSVPHQLSLWNRSLQAQLYIRLLESLSVSLSSLPCAVCLCRGNKCLCYAVTLYTVPFTQGLLLILVAGWWLASTSNLPVPSTPWMCVHNHAQLFVGASFQALVPMLGNKAIFRIESSPRFRDLLLIRCLPTPIEWDSTHFQLWATGNVNED